MGRVRLRWLNRLVNRALDVWKEAETEVRTYA